MKLKVDKNDVILYPENDMDKFIIGKLSVKIKTEVKFNANTFEPEQQMTQMKISIKDIMELLQQACHSKK
jgi:hypothetical protein